MKLIASACVGFVFVVAIQQAAAADACKPEDRSGGEIAEAIVGFQQTGASSAETTQSYFGDLFVSRPLAHFWNRNYTCLKVDPKDRGQNPDDDRADDNRLFGPRTRIWANVRISSYPQQVGTSAVRFISTFAAGVCAVPVNKLAQSAEFVTGLEWRLSTFHVPLAGNDELGRQRFVTSVFAGGGATGPLPPSETLQVFVAPAPGSPDYARFQQTYPKAANSQYIGFVSPDRDRFYRQYSVGLRMTTFYEDIYGAPYMAAPAMVSLSVGQNEQIASTVGGRFDGFVFRAEAFYPLVIRGDRGSRAGIVYLFGAAIMAISHSYANDPFILQPAPDVPGYDSRVAIITTPSTRDSYLIGVGIDVGQLVKKF